MLYQLSYTRARDPPAVYSPTRLFACSMVGVGFEPT